MSLILEGMGPSGTGGQDTAATYPLQSIIVDDDIGLETEVHLTQIEATVEISSPISMTLVPTIKEVEMTIVVDTDLIVETDVE